MIKQMKYIFEGLMSFLFNPKAQRSKISAKDAATDLATKVSIKLALATEGKAQTDIAEIISACIKPIITHIEEHRFIRTMEAMNYQLKSNKLISNHTTEEFFSWLNKDQEQAGFFHDSMRNALQSSSHISQVACGILIGQTYDKKCIDYNSSVLLRSLDGLNDNEINLLIEYWNLLGPNHTVKKSTLIISSHMIRQMVENQLPDRNQVEYIHEIFYYLASKRFFLVQGIDKIGSLGQTELVITDYTILIVNLLQDAKRMIKERNI